MLQQKRRASLGTCLLSLLVVLPLFGCDPIPSDYPSLRCGDDVHIIFTVDGVDTLDYSSSGGFYGCDEQYLESQELLWDGRSRWWFYWPVDAVGTYTKEDLNNDYRDPIAFHYDHHIFRVGPGSDATDIVLDIAGSEEDGDYRYFWGSFEAIAEHDSTLINISAVFSARKDVCTPF